MSLFGDSVFAGAPGPSAEAVIRAAKPGFENGFREIAAVRRLAPRGVSGRRLAAPGTGSLAFVHEAVHGYAASVAKVRGLDL